MAVSLESFRMLANTEAINGKDIVSIDNEGNVSATAPGRLGGHQVKVACGKSNALATRNALLDALNKKFDNNIPENVLKAMNVSKAFSGFAVGKDGVKATNHPLTMRRLQIIIEEVEKADAAGGKELQNVEKGGEKAVAAVGKESQTVEMGGEKALLVRMLDRYYPDVGKDRAMLVLGSALKYHHDIEAFVDCCKGAIYNSAIENLGAEEKAKLRAFAEELTAAYDKYEARVLKEEKAGDFTLVEMEDLDAIAEKSISHDYRTHSILKSFEDFESMTNQKLTPHQRRVAVFMRSESANPVKFDLSETANKDALKARLDDVRKGDCYGASPKTLQLMSALMYTDPKLAPDDVRLVLKMVSQCREQGIGQIATGKKNPLSTLKEMAKIVGKAVANEYATWDIARQKKEIAGQNALKDKQINNRRVELSKNEDTSRLFDLVMYALSEEFESVGQTIASLSLNDVVTCQAKELVAQGDAGLRLTPNQQRIHELLGLDKGDMSSKKEVSEDFEKKFASLSDKDKEELEARRQAEVESFVENRFASMSADDKAELETRQQTEIELFVEDMFIASAAIHEASTRYDANEVTTLADKMVDRILEKRA